MENDVFHCLVGEGKWGGRKTLEKVFSPKPTFLILHNWEEKTGEKTERATLFHKCPLFPNDHSKSAKKKKTIFQPPTQHNPIITTATQTRRKTHSKFKQKSIKTKSNGKPIRKIQQKLGLTCCRIYLAAAATASALLPSPDQPKWT